MRTVNKEYFLSSVSFSYWQFVFRQHVFDFIWYFLRSVAGNFLLNSCSLALRPGFESCQSTSFGSVMKPPSSQSTQTLIEGLGCKKD